MTSLPAGPFENAEAIYKGLLGMGLSPNAAAGVAGNIYQESHGNPRASNPAGGGLFGLTLANGGSVNGGPLDEQLTKLKEYIAQNGSVSDINAHASSPTNAAKWFNDHYERPGNPQIQNRIAGANWVADAAKSGNWSAGVKQQTGGNSSSGGGGLLDIPSEITTFFNDADKLITVLMWIVNPASWVRIGAFLVGVGLLLFAVYAFVSISQGGNVIPDVKIVPVPL